MTQRKSLPPLAVAGVLALLPFLYGAVHPAARAIYVGLAAALLIAHVAASVAARRTVAPRGVATVLAVLALSWAALSLLPLPAAVLAVLAPRTWELVIGAPTRAGLHPAAWHPIAVDVRSALEGFATGAAHLSIFAVASSSFAGRRGARTFAGALAACGSAISLLAIAESLTHASRIYWLGLRREQFYGTFVNGNHTATLLGVCALAALGLSLRERDPGKRAAFGVAAVISSAGVMHSLSRGGIVALAIGLAAFLGGAVATQAAARRKSADEIGRFFRRHAVLLMLVTLSVFYLSWLGPQRIGREVATLASLDLPNDYRTRVWEDSMKAVEDWPITGAGAGNFGEVFPAYRTFLTDVRTEMAESEYVQLAVETGVVGLGLLLGAAAAVLISFSARYVGDPLRFSGAHLGLAAGMILIVAHSGVDFPLRLPAMGAIAAAIAGSLARAVHRTRAVPRRAEVSVSVPIQRPRRRERVRRLMRSRAAAWTLVSASSAASIPFWVRPPDPSAARTTGEARARVLAAPGSAVEWIRLGRLALGDASGALDTRAIFATALALDPSRPEIHRAAADGLSRAGDARAAAAALRSAIDLYGDTGSTAIRARMRVDLARELLLTGNFEDAQHQLDVAGPGAGAHALEVRAELMAVRDDREPDLLAVADAFGAAARAFSFAKDPSSAVASIDRALGIAANDPDPARTRDAVDHLGRAADAGMVLAELAKLGMAPVEIRLDSHLAPVVPDRGEVLAHTADAAGERLELRYADAKIVEDLWESPLGVAAADPHLALRVRLRSDGRMGDQVCVRVRDRRVFGRMGDAGADGVRQAIVPLDSFIPADGSPASIDAWCLDTRGRPGPFTILEVALVRTP